MKKVLWFLMPCLLAVMNKAQAQNNEWTPNGGNLYYNYSGGKVGIGYSNGASLPDMFNVAGSGRFVNPSINSYTKIEPSIIRFKPMVGAEQMISYDGNNGFYISDELTAPSINSINGISASSFFSANGLTLLYGNNIKGLIFSGPIPNSYDMVVRRELNPSGPDIGQNLKFDFNFGLGYGFNMFVDDKTSFQNYFGGSPFTAGFLYSGSSHFVLGFDNVNHSINEGNDFLVKGQNAGSMPQGGRVRIYGGDGPSGGSVEINPGEGSNGKVRIANENGNEVIIGKQNDPDPNPRLKVHGTIAADNIMLTNSTLMQQNGSLKSNFITKSDYTDPNTITTTGIVEDDNGQVGIGFAVGEIPQAKLEVNGSAQVKYLVVRSDESQSSTIDIGPANNHWRFVQPANGTKLSIAKGLGDGSFQPGLLSLNPDNDGQVGVGTETPEAGIKLQVAGKIKAEDIELTNRKLASTTGVSEVGAVPVFYTDQGDMMSSMIAQSDSKVGIRVKGDAIKEHFQIGNQWTFHDGGQKIIANNTYWDGTNNVQTKIAPEVGASNIQMAEGWLAINTLDASGTNFDNVPELVVNENGKVGIGTNSIDTDIKLQVAGKIKAEDIELTSSTSKIARTATATPGAIPYYMDANGNMENSTMRQDPSGTISFGTNDNKAGLFVSGDIQIGSYPNQSGAKPRLKFFGNNQGLGGTSDNGDQIYFQRENEALDKSTLRLNIGDEPNTQDKFEVGYFNTQGWQKSVAIYNNGELWAKKVKVTLDDFPDYVFKPTYKLRTLKETEAFITVNGHLPEVPCAEEIAENGADLGELNKILLKKIEEMTLHLIRLEKEVNELKEQK